MINRTKIADTLYGIVGWRQPTNPDYDILDASNIASTSGLFVNDNAFAKIEFLKDNYDYVGVSDSDFNKWLKNLQKTAISTVANKVFNKPDFIDRTVLYKYASNKVNLETLPTGFVGYWIRVEDKKNIAFEISRVILEFSGSGSIDILLFNTAKSAPIQTKTVSITSSVMSVDLNWVVDNTSSTYKGDYYLGYISNGLAVTPYARDYESSNLMSNPTYLCIEKMQVTGHTTATMWDLTQRESSSNTWGLNPDITVYYDYTDLMIQNKQLFAYAIYMECAIKAIESYLASTRSNMIERLSKGLAAQAIVAIEGQVGEIKIPGLRNLLGSEISRLRAETEKLYDGYFANGITVHAAL